MQPIVIAGAGGMGREAHTWLRDVGEVDHLVGFVADPETPEGTTVLGLPVWANLDTPSSRFGALRIVMGVGSPAVKSLVARQGAALGCELMTVVHPQAYVGPDVELGPGAVVGPHAVVPRDNRVGAGTLVYYNATVGHDVRIGDFAYVAPGVVLGGHADIGDEAYIGVNASVLPTLTVGRRATVGAGAVVTSDVPNGHTVVGIPARRLAAN